MFNSLFTDGIVTSDIFICLGVSLLMGIIFSALCYFKTSSTKSFLMATAILPMVVCLVIIMVNGNIGAGVAIAGAFSLVRFRSAPGTAKEICIIFVSMASGLAFGMGYIAYGVIFILITGIALLIMEVLKIWDKKPSIKERNIRITIPEDLDYTNVFDEVFIKYTDDFSLVRVKSTNMGSMFRVTYFVKLKDEKREKEFVDELRTRNGNLEIMVERTDFAKSEL